MKELEPVQGWPYTEASLVFADRVSDHDSTMSQLTGWLQAGVISPSLSDVMKLSEGATALRRLANRDVMGKIVLVP